MTKKKMWRYYCGFCRKSGGNGGIILKHEQHCTKNPNRVCRMCVLLGLKQTPIAELLSILPDPEKFKSTDEYGLTYYRGLEEAVKEPFKRLRDITKACPMCLLASLRQKNIPTPIVKDFDYKKELKETWGDINSDNGEVY